MISIIITSFKEPKTIGKAIESFLKQNLMDYELIVSAPDDETLNVARKYSGINKRVKVVKDPGKGKPMALNQIFKIAKGEILILSDGDVYVSPDSVKKLVNHFKEKNIGGVSGRVVSLNSRQRMFGYWAYILTETFHKLRLREMARGKNVLCSGYFYAVRSGIVKEIPEEILADDAFISLMIENKGYKLIYEPKAEVYVKYPGNLKDWISQKKRTAGRYYQLKKYFKISKMSSFGKEAFTSLSSAFLIRNFKEVFYFIFLVVMRFYIWFRVFFDFRLWNRDFSKTWERVESTK